ncbi:synaptosomal-associated protein 29 [Trichonephila inaurata madagascariensis]|uniref:Synaptosomal-associated protein 29 n=1 Tax=Trichonephila inaurata madagascariensis TaxID=2747483 RepID=A0A8X7CSQ0_9ARAC|nr:synaptosomal-associated protein 29 [Trichonephila inaurata madagascariensis]
MAKEIKSNPFLDDDDDVDDNEFLNHPRQGKSGYILGNNSVGSEQNQWEIRRQQLLEERRRIEERTLQSTNNSIGLLHESEQVGILTAEELVKQREQLENIEENLDFINSTMRTSQKHINSLKSIFGGIKNYFSKGGQQDPAVSIPVDISERKHSSALNTTIDNLKSDTRLSEATHPALRVRNLPYDDTDSFGNDLSPVKTPSPVATKSTNNIEEKLDKNLEFMSMGLGRLKNLAIGLNDEIEQQNEMIDTIHNKADKADETLEYQNRQIKRILKK